MKLKIEIKMDNAAFTDNDNPGAEAARILKTLAVDLENITPTRRDTWSLRDINGNSVGKARVTQ